MCEDSSLCPVQPGPLSRPALIDVEFARSLRLFCGGFGTSGETQVIRDSGSSLVVYPGLSDVRLTCVSLENKF